MEYKKEVPSKKLVRVERICDCCGAKESDYQKSYPDEPMPMIALEGSWGYASKKDLEHHKSLICEDCYDKIIEDYNIKPLIKMYRPMDRFRSGDEMYINLSDEKANGDIMDGPDGMPRYENEEWRAAREKEAKEKEEVPKEEEPPTDRLREWANKFIQDFRHLESYGGPPPEGESARYKMRQIVQELKEAME